MANTKINASQQFTSNADWSANSFKITNLATPTNGTDAVNKNYVDSVAAGLDVKISVRVATTTNITLSATQTIDGIALSVNDRVLVKNQSTASQNGIYIVASGAWTRSTDANISSQVTPGMYTFVEEGTTQADSGWILTTDGVIVLDTTSLSFAQFSGAGQITAGAGLTKTGNTLDIITASTARIVVNADSIDLATTTVSANSYGTSGFKVPYYTVDSYGRLTASAEKDLFGSTTMTTNTIFAGPASGAAAAATFRALNLADMIVGLTPASTTATIPTNGQLMIGNGTAFALAALTQGTGITITNGIGTITIANAGVTTVNGSSGAVANIAVTTGTLGQFAVTTSLQLLGVISDETGSGSLVFANTPTLVTPILGVATATTINKVTITTPTTSAILTIADGKTLTASNTLTFSGTDGSSLIIGTGGTLGTNAYTSTAYLATASFTDAAVTSKVLTGYVSGAGIISATDTILQAINKLNGNVASAVAGGVSTITVTANNGITQSVTGTSAITITLGLGAITPTSVNGLTITANGTNTLNIAAGKSLILSNTLTFTGTDSSSIAFGTGGTVAYLANANAFTGANTLTNATGQTFRSAATQDGIIIVGRAGGTTSLTTTFIPGTLASSNTLTLPTATGTLALTSATISGVALGGTLYGLSIGTGLIWTVGTTYTGTAVATLAVDDIAAGTPVAWNTVTTGSITIGGGLTTGSLNLATGANTTKIINIGTASATTSVTGIVKLPTVGTSGLVRLGAGGQLSADSTTYVNISKIIVRENNAFTANGVNTTYTFANTILAGTEEVYVNGLLQRGGGNDYSATTTTVVFQTGSIPQTGDYVQVNYIAV